jgi:hypothetical protein
MYRINRSAVSTAIAFLFRFICVAAAIAGMVVMTGCAHPISIEAKSLPTKGEALSPKKAAYVMTETDRQKQITTQGGGGDKVSYYPYKDFERAMRAALSTVYSDVSVVGSATDLTAIQATGASFVFRPEITTTSSSPSAFTWPPTKFSVSVLVEVFDPQANIVARLRVTGNGAAEFDEFKSELGLAGRRAVEDAARLLAEEIARSAALK